MKLKYLLLIFLLQPCSFCKAEEYEEGILTSHLNKTLQNKVENSLLPEKKDLVSAPKLGAYIIGSYTYSGEKGTHGGAGFSIRLLRAYVSGFLLKDFKYRIQLEMNSSVALRDATIEWKHWIPFSIKFGQFKRCFTFENSMNPFDVGVGSYSQLVYRLTGFGDYCGEPSMNGRDRGIQCYGDVLPIGKSKHALFHYEIGVYNGNGQNRADNNGMKDIIGTFQIRPIKNLTLAWFGWKGNYLQDEVTVGRNRWGISGRYDGPIVTARAEYAHNTGHRIQDYDKINKTWSGTGRADAWYATVGIQATRWFKPYIKYDVYRSQGTWESARNIYSFCPNFQLHKNLLFQIQTDLIDDKSKAQGLTLQCIAEAYIRI